MSNKRLREIIGVFSAVGLTTLKEKGKPLKDKSTPRKLRLAFEKLGPSFIKIGQILSTRSDLLPDVYIKELSKLQNDVIPLPQEEMLAAIKAELPVPMSEVFAEIGTTPLASGSVAQTVRATLVDGQQVVIKIQRPHLPEIINEDLNLLIRLSRFIPKGILPMVNFGEVFEQLKESLSREIDFRNEAQAIQTFSDLNKSVACIATPRLFDSYTTPRMLVEEYVEGIPINHYDELVKAGYDLEDIGKKLMLSFIKQVFKDGYFHGDPHPGNLLISEGKIYFIDFGIIAQLENEIRFPHNKII